MQNSKEQQGEIKSLPQWSMKKKKKKNKTIEWKRLEISSCKLEIPRNSSCKDGDDKGKEQYVANRSRRY